MAIQQLLDTATMHQCQLVLSSHIGDYPHTIAVLLCSEDGFEIASEALAPEAMNRLAAMTSSMVALGDAIAREMALGASNSLMIEADDGRVVMQALNAGGFRMMLAMLVRPAMTAHELAVAVDVCTAHLTLCVGGD